MPSVANSRASTIRLRSSIRAGSIARRDAVPFRQLLAGEGRSKVVPVPLLQQLDRLTAHLRGYLTVGSPSSKAVNHHTIAVPFHPLQQLAHPTIGHSHPPGRLALADHS